MAGVALVDLYETVVGVESLAEAQTDWGFSVCPLKNAVIFILSYGITQALFYALWLQMRRLGQEVVINLFACLRRRSKLPSFNEIFVAWSDTLVPTTQFIFGPLTIMWPRTSLLFIAVSILFPCHSSYIIIKLWASRWAILASTTAQYLFVRTVNAWIRFIDSYSAGHVVIIFWWRKPVYLRMPLIGKTRSVQLCVSLLPSVIVIISFISFKPFELLCVNLVSFS